MMILKRFLGILFGFYTLPAAALYVCEINGEKTIVQQNQGAHCQPYVAGMFGKTSAPAAPAVPEEAPTEALPSPEELMKSALQKALQPNTDLVEKPLTWACPQKEGGITIIESQDQPLDDCRVQEALPVYKGKSARATLLNHPQPQENTQDVYQCRDDNGKVSYVAADQRHHFHDCHFWSRSFAQVRQSMQQQNFLDTPSSFDRKRLLCSGAGEVIFNGQRHEYQCARHSYDYTAGTTGGSLRFGEQNIQFEAHTLDYFNEQGNCGGTVMAENGRILHFEANKNCPPAIRKAVAKIEQEVKQALDFYSNPPNVKVSGAFRERQKSLAPLINSIAQEIGVDPFFVHAIISAESAYKPRAKSHAGAMGLMQLMPATAKRFKVTDPYHPEQNIRGGTTYLKWLLKNFNGDMRLAAAGYNAGEGNVRKYGNKIPPFVETRAYVPKVMEYYQRYRANPAEVGL